MLKVACVGSRDFGEEINLKVIASIRERLMKFDKSTRSEITIVSGAADGVDTWSVNIGVELGMKKLEFPAQWRINGVYDAGAGMKRNTDIINAADMVLAWWDGKSKGTKDSVSKAKKRGIPVEVFNSTTNEVTYYNSDKNSEKDVPYQNSLF